MIRRFINWLKGSHSKRSAALIESFSETKTALQSLNSEIVAEQERNDKEISKLIAKQESLAATFSRNEVVAINIAKLLGEEETV